MIATRTVTGPHEVPVMICEGPGCGAERGLDAGYGPWHLIDDKAIAPHVWSHFCSYRCLSAWAWVQGQLESASR